MKKEKKPTPAEFITKTPPAEQKKVIEEIARGVNEDQRAVKEKLEQLKKKAEELYDDVKAFGYAENEMLGPTKEDDERLLQEWLSLLDKTASLTRQQTIEEVLSVKPEEDRVAGQRFGLSLEQRASLTQWEKNINEIKL